MAQHVCVCAYSHTAASGIQMNIKYLDGVSMCFILVTFRLSIPV